MKKLCRFRVWEPGWWWSVFHNVSCSFSLLYDSLAIVRM